MKSDHCHHSNEAIEQYFPVVLFELCYTDNMGPTFESVDPILKSDNKRKLLSSNYLWYCLLCCMR